MKNDTPYIVALDDKIHSVPQFSVYRYWRRLHRQQRTFIFAFILICFIIYLGYRSHSTTVSQPLVSEYHRKLIEKDKGEWQKKQIEKNQLTKIIAKKQFFFDSD